MATDKEKFEQFQNIIKTVNMARDELSRANQLWPRMVSAHEGYAVILEELDELWELVKMKQTEHDYVKMQKEAIQIAAMALRFVTDVTLPMLKETESGWERF